MPTGICGISRERYGISRGICGIFRRDAASPTGYAFTDIFVVQKN
jgi:hypothetical protein